MPHAITTGHPDYGIDDHDTISRVTCEECALTGYQAITWVWRCVYGEGTWWEGDWRCPDCEHVNVITEDTEP